MGSTDRSPTGMLHRSVAGSEGSEHSVVVGLCGGAIPPLVHILQHGENFFNLHSKTLCQFLICQSADDGVLLRGEQFFHLLVGCPGVHGDWCELNLL